LETLAQLRQAVQIALAYKSCNFTTFIDGGMRVKNAGMRVKDERLHEVYVKRDFRENQNSILRKVLH